MTSEFEADLSPDTHQPRVRFNFNNGWSASLVIRTGARHERCFAMQATLAACPTGRWGTGLTELGEQEATADEAIAWLDMIQRRPPTAYAEPQLDGIHLPGD